MIKIILLFCFLYVCNSVNYKISHIFNSLKTPSNIVISQNIFKTINYQVFSKFINEQLTSPILIKESIYIPIVIIYLLNEYLNFKYKERNQKLDNISLNNTYKIKKIINQFIFIINIVFIKDIETSS